MAVALFGTDGVRGTANKYPMTPDIARKSGIAAGRVLKRGSHRHTVVIGKDTRLSGYIFEPALTNTFSIVVITSLLTSILLKASVVELKTILSFIVCAYESITSTENNFSSVSSLLPHSDE